MRKLFWLFLMALTAFTKDIHAALEKNLSESNKENNATHLLRSFLKTPKPDAGGLGIEEINKSFTNLSPETKRGIFLESFDNFINENSDCNRKNFKMFFKEQYLKLDKELSTTLLIDLLGEGNYLKFKKIISDQEVVALFNRIQDSFHDEGEKKNFRAKILNKILPLTFEKNIHKFFCEEYNLLCSEMQHEVLQNAAGNYSMREFVTNQYLLRNQTPQEKLELLKAMSSCFFSTETDQTRPEEKGAHTSFILEHFKSSFDEYENEKDESVEGASKKSQFARNLKADIIANLLCKNGPSRGLQYSESLKSMIKNEFNILSFSEKMFVIGELFQDSNDELPLNLFMSMATKDPELFQKVSASPTLLEILTKLPIKDPQDKILRQWFEENFEHLDYTLQARAAELIITPDNVRSFTQKVVGKISLQSNYDIVKMGFGFFTTRENKDNVLDIAIENFNKNNFDLQTADLGNSSLQTRNENLNTFINDLLEILNNLQYGGYHKSIHETALDNNKKLKNSISCMKELLGDKETDLLLQNYDFKRFLNEDRQSFCNLSYEIGYIGTLNFVNDSFFCETGIEGLKDGTFNAICLSVSQERQKNNKNPTGLIDLEDKEWRLNYRSLDQVVSVEFSAEEQQTIRDFNQKNSLPKEKLIENLNTFMERFKEFAKETLPNTKKSAKESDEKKCTNLS